MQDTPTVSSQFRSAEFYACSSDFWRGTKEHTKNGIRVEGFFLRISGLGCRVQIRGVEFCEVQGLSSTPVSRACVSYRRICRFLLPAQRVIARPNEFLLEIWAAKTLRQLQSHVPNCSAVAAAWLPFI